MKWLLLLFYSLSFQAFALEFETSGSIEGQTRISKNNSEAKSIAQDWKWSNFNLLSGQLQQKVTHKSLVFEAGGVARYARSPLYRDNFVAPVLFNYPPNIVSRDFFKSQYQHRGESDYTQASVSVFSLQYSYKKFRADAGRILINYGNGEIYNPLNPFAIPAGLMTQRSFGQSSDGIQFTTFFTDKLTLKNYYLLDRSLYNYGGKISETFWATLDYKVRPKFEVLFVGGQDQDRQKWGGQLTSEGEEAMMFLQTLYQTARRDGAPSEHLWSVVMGYDQQLNGQWHLRMEGGHQKIDRAQVTLNPFSLTTQLLPSEYFLSTAFEVSPENYPLLKLNFTHVHDFKTRLGLALLRALYSIKQNLDIQVFALTPIYRDSKKLSAAQKVITQDLGLSLSHYF